MESIYGKRFLQIIAEDMTAGAGTGGVFGAQQDTTQGDLGLPTDDSYAEGDARLPKVLGKVQRRVEKDKKKSKKRKKSKK